MSYRFSAAELLEEKLDYKIRQYIGEDAKYMSPSEVDSLVEHIKEEFIDELLDQVAAKSPRIHELLKKK